jgi:hypothetical protein
VIRAVHLDVVPHDHLITLVEERDPRMVRAKANGRNRVEMFTLDAATEDEPGPGTIASATPASS